MEVKQGGPNLLKARARLNRQELRVQAVSEAAVLHDQCDGVRRRPAQLQDPVQVDHVRVPELVQHVRLSCEQGTCYLVPEVAL